MSRLELPKIARHGLTTVFIPDPGLKAIAHIVFVHGLFGDPEKTWTGPHPQSNLLPPHTKQESPQKERDGADPKADTSKDGIFWPAILLPEVIGNAQISTWGYDADIDDFRSSASQNTITQHATNLLSDLATVLEADRRPLPIIFVIHSLGGIVVKAAMNQSAATHGTRLKIVVPNVTGVVFLGTPHRGSRSASIGKMAYHITTIATRRPNIKLLRALERNSETLEDIGKTFLQTLDGQPNIEIYSFREEKETRKYWFFNTMVVEPDSAQIGLAKEEVSSVPASHSDMTKFSSLDEIGFKRVSAQLKRWVQSLPTFPSGTCDDPEHIDLVTSLNIMETQTRIKALEPAHAKTLQWLYDQSVVTFSDWLEDSNHDYKPIYWIQGLPGSGKSTLMKFAMFDTRTADLLDKERLSEECYILAGFFFHDRGSLIQKSIEGMFQGLLYSILRQARQLRSFVQPIYMQLAEVQKTKTPSWDQDSLLKAFEAIAQQREVPTRLCLFLDALDEYHGNNEQLVALVDHLVSRADRDVVRIKFCLASRPWDTFVNHFSKYPGFRIQEHTFEDILEYAISKLYDASPVRVKDEPSADSRLQELAKKIATEAHGVFIWVRIVTEEIADGVRSRTPHFRLVDALVKMPRELKELYEHTLERIDPRHAEEAYVMLQIAVCAISPLALDTFANTTSLVLWGHFPAPGEESKEDMIQRTISRSGGLLEVAVSKTEDSVQFIHQTVKEYVEKRKDNLGLRRETTGGNGYEFILTAAVTCWDDWADEIGRDCFEYATLAQSVGTPGDILRDQLSKLATDGPNIITSQDQTLPREPPLISSKPTRLDWWCLKRALQPNVKFYIDNIFPLNLSAFDRLLILVCAAGLDSVVWWSELRHLETQEPGVLLCVATIGPKITLAHRPRKAILNSLIRGGVSIKNCFIPDQVHNKYDSHSLVQEPLVLLIFSKGMYNQDEGERISTITFLLENGADPNVLFHKFFGVEDELGNLIVKNNGQDIFSYRLFSQILKRESAEVVRLFGRFGARLPPYLTIGCQLWSRIINPSDVLQEVLHILSRDYPGNFVNQDGGVIFQYRDESGIVHEQIPVAGSDITTFSLLVAITTSIAKILY